MQAASVHREYRAHSRCAPSLERTEEGCASPSRARTILQIKNFPLQIEVLLQQREQFPSRIHEARLELGVTGLPRDFVRDAQIVQQRDHRVSVRMCGHVSGQRRANSGPRPQTAWPVWGMHLDEAPKLLPRLLPQKGAARA